MQYYNSKRANSIFTNEVFAIIYTNLSILERTEAQSTSPVQTSKHTKVRNEIAALSTFLNAIRENFQNTKQDLQKILAWFTIDYFTLNIDLIEQARKDFRPQSTNDDTVIAEKSDYVWDSKRSHPAFLKFPVDISSRAINKISLHPDYVKLTPLTIDATPLNLIDFHPTHKIIA